MKITRFDSAPITKFTRLPSGGVRVDAVVTRTGVLPYSFSDGTVRRELRPPEEVFSPESLATIPGVAVTLGHPPTLINTDNFASLAHGHAGDHVTHDEKYVMVPLSIQTTPAIGEVERRDRTETSMGYTAEFDPTPGVWEGEAYDGVQRTIRYNHVSLERPGHGRAGREVGLRLDSESAICDVMSTSAPAGTPAVSPVTVKVRLDGIEYDFGSPSHVSALEARNTAAVARAEKAEVALAAASKRLDAIDAASKKADAKELRRKARLVIPRYKDAADEELDATPDMGIVDEILKALGVDGSSLSDQEKLIALKAAWQAKHGSGDMGSAEKKEAPPGPAGPPQDSRFVVRAAPVVKTDAADAAEPSQEAAIARAREKAENAWKHKKA